MRKLAELILKGPLAATLVAAGGAVLALLLPPFSAPLAYVGGASVALVTLRGGMRNGALVMAAGAVAAGVLGALLMGQPSAVVVATLLLWLPLWLTAAVLRSTRSLRLALQTAAATGVLTVLAMHVAVSDLDAWWLERLQPVFAPLLEQGGADAEALLTLAAHWMTGLLAAGLVMGVMMSLLLARWWQALLYNPGGFGSEFRDLRLDRAIGWLSLVLLLAARFIEGGAGTIAAHLLFVLAVAYVLIGLALLHALVRARTAHRGWLIGAYVLMLFWPGQMMTGLAFTGWLDTWFDLRRRFLQGGSR